MARFKLLIAQSIALLTSPQAIALYRRAGRYAVLCLQGAVALLLVLGVACFVLGWCCRQGVREAKEWSDGFVAACERQEEPQQAIAPVASPVALLPAPQPIEETRVLVTPAPAIAPPVVGMVAVAEEVKVVKRRGRPKGSKGKKSA